MPQIPRPRILEWTKHARAKMRQYGLSEARVRRVLHSPYRSEEGIAPETSAFMQPATFKSTKENRKDWTQEIWVMTKDARNKRVVISAWRYPGKTKPGEVLPTEITVEIEEGLGDIEAS